MRYAISTFTLAAVLATGAAFAQTNATTPAPKSSVTAAAPATTVKATKKTHKHHRHHAKKAAAGAATSPNAATGSAQAPASKK